MPNLNRFPLLGLWAKEAARRIGYTKDESEALGHAYAVLYAIRAAGTAKKKEAHGKASEEAAAAQQLEFCGDKLDVTHDANGKVHGLVGHEEPQTAASYRKHVPRKFPPDYYPRVEESFRRLLHTYPPRQVNSRLVYDVYDQWKKACGVGRLVDLDKLIAWCDKRAAEREAKA